MNMGLPILTIFCTCEKKYEKVRKEFKLDNINIIFDKEEALKKEDIEDIIHKSKICYVIIDLDQQRDLKIAEYIYEISKRKRIFTIGIGVKPSSLQNEEGRKFSDFRILRLKNNLDSLIIIDNEVLVNDENITVDIIEKQSDDIVIKALKAVIYPISLSGQVNIDLSELKNIMGGNTIAYFGFGRASGMNRAERAGEEAINSKFLLESLQKSAKQLLMIEGDPSMKLLEIDDVTKKIPDIADSSANIEFGAFLNQNFKDEIQVSIVAAGYKLQK